MTQTTDNGQPTSSGGDASARGVDAPRREPLSFAWTLFIAVWLLYPATFAVQMLQSDLSPLQMLTFLASLVAFVAIFLLLMLRYPFPTPGLAFRELRVRIGLLLVLAALALCVELVYGSGVPYRFMYVVIAVAVTLPTRYASWMVVTTTALASAVYALQLGWAAFARSWPDLIPFALIGIGMILVNWLVVTVRELQTARREIAQLAAAEAVAKERLRFARDLHDLLGHSLSSITLKSELAGRLLPDIPETRKAAAEVRDIQGIARGALREVREAVAGYRQPVLSEELIGAKAMLEAAGIACRIDNSAGLLPNSVEGVLAWAVREGTTNVIRHSHADRCEIRVMRDGGWVYSEITDDGHGSSAEGDGMTVGSGLSGLAERVETSGGNFEAGPLREGGFHLRVSLPLHGDASSDVEQGSVVREEGP